MEQNVCEIKHEPEYIISESEDSDNCQQEDEDVNIFKCIICGKEFSFQNQLIYHKKIHAVRKNERKAWQNWKDVLKDFLETDPHKNIYKCKICKKKMKVSLSFATNHVAVHFGSELTKCSYCGKNFSTKYSKIAHEKSHQSQG